MFAVCRVTTIAMEGDWMSRQEILIGYRSYGFRDLLSDLATGFSAPGDEGFAVVIVSGNRSWRIRTLFTSEDSAEQVAGQLRSELASTDLERVLAGHTFVRLSSGARKRLHAR